MTDVLDRLRADNPVRAGSAPSVDEVWARLERQDQVTDQHWLRSPWRAAATMVSIIIPFAIAALALGLLGHSTASHPSTRSSSSPPPSVRSTGRAVPTLGQLLANFAILRRPQTAADRSWLPGAGVVNARPVSKFTRLARQLPNGDRVFLSIARFQKTPGGHSPSAGNYSLNIDVLSPHGTDASASFVPNVNYTIVPISSLGPRAAARKAPTWASIVPDGVTRVRWRFACPPGRAGHCRQQPPTTVTVPVRGNVAAASVPRTDEICDRSQRQCRTPVAITWYGGDGRVVASYSPFALHNLSAPPFITTNPARAAS